MARRLRCRGERRRECDRRAKLKHYANDLHDRLLVEEVGMVGIADAMMPRCHARSNDTLGAAIYQLVRSTHRIAYSARISRLSNALVVVARKAAPDGSKRSGKTLTVSTTN